MARVCVWLAFVTCLQYACKYMQSHCVCMGAPLAAEQLRRGGVASLAVHMRGRCSIGCCSPSRAAARPGRCLTPSQADQATRLKHNPPSIDPRQGLSMPIARPHIPLPQPLNPPTHHHTTCSPPPHPRHQHRPPGPSCHVRKGAGIPLQAAARVDKELAQLKLRGSAHGAISSCVQLGISWCCCPCCCRSCCCCCW